MSQYSLLIIILVGALQAVCSGEEAFNPFGPSVNREPGLENPEPSREGDFYYESNEAPADEKIIEKRRLYFNEEDPKAPGNTERHPESNEFLSRKKSNFSEPENEQLRPEFQQGLNTWDDERNRFSLLGPQANLRNPEDVRSLQDFVAQTHFNRKPDWDRRGDSFGNSQNRWNEENNFKQFGNAAPSQRMGNNYGGRTQPIFQNKEMNSFSADGQQDVFNRRISMTTLQDREMGQSKNFDRMGEMDPSFTAHPNINYYNRNPASLWNSCLNTPEKGVIINFNTECPRPSQFSGNQLVHKFIFNPKASVESLPPLQSVQETDLISSPRMTPMYYL